MNFVDRVEVILQAGDGGDGVVSFRHAMFRPRGGPDGGDGGDGGGIILRASRNQDTLAAFRYKKLLKAEDGKLGSRQRRHGKSGQDLEVPVPVGTVVNSLAGEMLADLTTDDQRVTIARGGRGGFGNAHFVSSTRRTPRVAEKGEKGQAIRAVLELKMIADVGIVGLPNAGKSTLLSVISNAKPEIASYPFTTLQPHLGVVDIDSRHSLLFADIPGLIAGASQGKGLGDEFLRHIERTNLLVHLIDFYNDDVAAAYKTIMAELKAYRVDLSGRPQIVVLTKTEGVDKKAVQAKIKQLAKLVPKNTVVLAISSQSGEGLQELLRQALARVSVEKKKVSRRSAAHPKLPVIGLRSDDEVWHIKKQAAKFVVTGPKIERFAARTNFGDHHGEQRLRDIMQKMGISRELERQGIEPEQVVTIGEPPLGELEY